MKKVLFMLTVGFTFIAVFFKSTYAQNSEKLVDPNIKKNFLSSIRNLANLDDPDLTGAYILKRNEVNIRAVRDFLYRFDTVDNALWFAGPNDGFEAYFVQDGFGERVMYDKNGGWQMSIITYREEKLSRNIRFLVKSTYFDYDIILVEELNIRDGVEYVVYLEDKLNIRIVKVNNGDELEVLQDLNK
jgi:hypothetical protein